MIYVVLLLIAFASSTALAQSTGLQGYNLLTFKPTIDGSGILQTVGTKSLEPWQIHEGLYLSSNKGLLRRESMGLKTVNPGPDVIRWQFVDDTVLAIGLPGSITTGLDIPVVMYQRGQNLTGTPYAQSELGDIRYFVKWNFLKDNPSLFGAAIVLNTYIPTGTQALFTGSSEAMQDFMLVLDKKWENIYLGLNFGFQIAPNDNFTVAAGPPAVIQGSGNRYLFSTGVKVPLAIQKKSWAVFSDFTGSWLARNLVQNSFPTEAIIGIEKHFASNIDFLLGNSIRITNAMGEPLRRYFIALRWTSTRESKTAE